MIDIKLPQDQKVYFSSDQHFGAPDPESSREREKTFVKWLDEIKSDCHSLFIVGDLFDFWFEYKKVVPKGFVRVLGKLAELRDTGINVYLFVGNHDLWMRDYFPTEFDIPVFHQPQQLSINGSRVYLAHGDGLGPGDQGYKFMKKIFLNPICKRLFRALHPDLGVRLAQYLSLNNKLISGDADITFLGKEEEWLVQYSLEILEKEPFDYFIYGHRHLPMTIQLNDSSKYLNLGDWIQYNTYAVFDKGKIELKALDSKTELPYYY